MNFRKLVHILDKSPLDKHIHIPEGCDIDSVELEGMVCDSRKAAPGLMFAAAKGDHADGYNFIEQAVAKGAPAVLCERESAASVPQIITPDVRSAMGYVCSMIHDEPSRRMTMIAVTGTNGKTTSAFMTQAILNHCGIKTGLAGTVIYDDGAVIEEAEHTTPEGADLQNLFARMVKNGCKACVMEVSSHSLVQGRVSGTAYDRAGFTNLTIDHLDFHKTMENYFNAKKILFDKYMRNNWQACVNVDDEYGRRLRDFLGKRAITYAMLDESADFFASIKNFSLDGLDIEIKMPGAGGVKALKLPLLGGYNVLNALQALSLAWSVGVSANCALDALAHMPQVPGRLERYKIEGGGTCVIDFAHTLGRAGKGAHRRKADMQGQAHRRLRRGRRPRQDEAPHHGRDSLSPRRQRNRNVGQPAHGGADGDNLRNTARRAEARHALQRHARPPRGDIRRAGHGRRGRRRRNRGARPGNEADFEGRADSSRR